MYSVNSKESFLCVQIVADQLFQSPQIHKNTFKKYWYNTKIYPSKQGETFDSYEYILLIHCMKIRKNKGNCEFSQIQCSGKTAVIFRLQQINFYFSNSYC